MIDIDLNIAQKILMEAIRQSPPVGAPAKTLEEIARESGLEIAPINMTRGNYFGWVRGIDETRCLVEYRTKGAILLDLDKIPEGEILPSGGDQVHIQAKEGTIKVAVKVAAKRQREGQ